MSIKQKVVHGLLWSVGNQVGVQLVSLGIQLVLARLLAPEIFGLLAMLQVFLAIGQTLVDGGMTSSLIRTVDADERDFSTVFYLNLLFSVAVYLLVFAAAPWVADFYEQPQLTSILRVLSVTIILQAFVSVQNTWLTKEMNFKLQAQMQIPSYIIGGAVGLLLAWLGYGVWSLVWMNIARTASWALQHWLFMRWRPQWIFDRSRMKEHLRFGYRLTLSGVIDAVYTNISGVLIGRFFPIRLLGYYDRAFLLRQVPVQTLTAALNKVSFPLFSRLQNEPDKLRLSYQKMMQFALFILAPVLTLAAVVAEPLVVFLLGKDWVASAPYLRILCFAGILMPIHSFNLNILNVKGRSDLFLRLEIIKRIILTVLLFAALPLGITGLLYAQVLVTIISFFINSYYSGRMIQYSSWSQVADLLPILLLTALTGLATRGVMWLADFGGWLPHFIWLQLLLAGGVFSLCYIGFAWLLKIRTFIEVKQYIFSNDSGQ